MSKPVVYVDLDGTLTPSDVLIESCLLLLRKNLLYGFAMIFWALKGGLYLKQRVALHVKPDMRHLPMNAQVLARLNEFKAAGHELVLASASLLRDVSSLAQRLGIFDRVLATTNENLKGVRKLRAIQADANGVPFVYFGDSEVDLPIWQEASVAYAVNASALVHARAKLQGVVLHRIDSPSVSIRAWLKAVRFQQWAKNALLFLPLIAAHEQSLELWALALNAFLAFGLVASATYLWNDLMDLEADRQHPRKCKRPMACGVISIPKALMCMLLLGGLGFAVACVQVGVAFALVLLGYALVTLLYTFVLKRTAFVDVLLLAMLYTVRVIAGGVATGIALSSWLLAISLFVFLSLALVKRCAELEFLSEQGSQPQGRGYRMSDLSYLVSMGISSGFVAVLVLALYVDSQNGTRLYRHPEFLWAICPLFLYWLMRIWILTSRKEMIDDPVHFALHDPVSWAVVLTAGALIFLAA